MRGAGGLVAPAPPVQAPAAAQLTYRSGPLLTAVDVATVFWGAAWNEAGAQATAQSLNDFFQFVVASPYLDQLGEYGTAQQKIGLQYGGWKDSFAWKFTPADSTSSCRCRCSTNSARRPRGSSTSNPRAAT